MPHLTTAAKRHGFTLVELLVALMLFAIMGGAMVRVLTSQQRAYNSQLQRTGLQQNIRVAGTLLPNEFRGLNPADSDIVAMSDTSLTVRSIQQLGVVCNPPVLGGALTGLTVTMRGPLYTAARSFVAGDSVFAWYEGDGSKRDDDGWVRGKVTAAANGSCPTLPNAGADPLLTLSFALRPTQPNAAGSIPTGSPILGYENRTYRLFQTGGRWYLGLARGAGATDQLIGPLIGSTGLTFSYLDAAGAVTAVPTAVTTINVTLRAETKDPIRKSDGSFGTAKDSVVLAVVVRNRPRF
jgi:prepilin-type N-terminal cleavage/methylation domain-containing protein